MKDEEYRCPNCGGPLWWRSACPGFRRNGKVMVCVGCGNADEWECYDQSCGWWYREPNIRSDKVLMGKRPDWLPKENANA